ncbi:flagellar protein FliT [Methylophaga sp. OBS1]|jgi:hypothetical protein|uniref:flagellar protein FliT n=1 Tax=Methylophaga sp. OBS1 TaxID=2991933 RepID=UPI002255E11C|nr:flagellar protein FliT [Methylophaga sp. OBS1]MCX4193857.1 flagellar protein FliT [Methylophaga sp. OBS1]
MTQTKLIQLKRAADLTSTMLQMAEAGQWSGLSEFQKQRTDLLQQCFPLDAEQQTLDVRAVVETMIAQNQQLEQLCRQAQQSLQTELRGLNNNRKAVAAYQSS